MPNSISIGDQVRLLEACDQDFRGTVSEIKTEEGLRSCLVIHDEESHWLPAPMLKKEL